jgi:hypothetical protein
VPQTVRVLSAGGQPVSGGSISWSASGVSSAIAYGLTSNGQIQFPAAPAGEATVTLKDGVLPDGDYVSGTFKTVLGFSGPASLRLPAEPSTGVTVINVQTPGGLNLPGATISVPGVTQTTVVDGVTFTTPQIAKSGASDVNGNFTVSGFISDNSVVNVGYNDGVIVQSVSAAITQPLTSVTLPYAPVVSPTSSSATTTAGSVVSVTLSASGLSGASIAHLRSNSGTGSMRTLAAKRGVAVTAILPKGFKACRAQRLSGLTGGQGTVTLKFCATTTGVVTFKAIGAYATGHFQVFVNGTVPTSVIGLIASTPSLGHAEVSWTKPVFSGGVAISKYVLTFSAKGQKTVVAQSVKTSALVSGLANATHYNVSVVAFNKFGNSVPSSIGVSVA